jgi:SPP1 family predicted phage head-tail adaptor
MIGALRHRVTLQSKTYSTSSTGEKTASYTAAASNLPARVDAVSAGEQSRAGQLLPKALWRVLMRYRSDVANDSRIVWGARTLEVAGVQEDAKQRWLTVTAQEVPAT